MQTRSQTRKIANALNEKALNEKALDENAFDEPIIQHRVLPDTILYSNLPKKRGPQYKITIDFDEASKAWRANKIPIGDGQFKYKGNLRFPCNETC